VIFEGISSKPRSEFPRILFSKSHRIRHKVSRATRGEVIKNLITPATPGASLQTNREEVISG
jgi:hypothetical protein